MYAILEHNPQLLPFASEIEARVQRWKQVKKDLLRFFLPWLIFCLTDALQSLCTEVKAVLSEPAAGR